MTPTGTGQAWETIITKIRASVYNIGGWYDILLEGTINNYLKMTAPDIDPGNQKKAEAP